jgi:SAM-dependent methyltransferase
VEHLRLILWKQDHVDVVACPQCGFGFTVPWVGGDAEFYALAHDGDPHYPSERWEFGETVAALSAFPRPLKLAEVGAGDGAFLDLLDDRCEIVAADFDRGAVARLTAKGYQASVGSLDELRRSDSAPFDVVCLFHTLEHMAELEDVFSSLAASLTPGGSVFVSVPDAAATDFQERVTGLWDMPPNHVGRWTADALRAVGARHGFFVAATRQSPIRTLELTREMAVSAINARSCQPGSVASRVNAISSRPIRGGLKRVLAAAWVPRLLAQRSAFAPPVCWVHLRLAG